MFNGVLILLMAIRADYAVSAASKKSSGSDFVYPGPVTGSRGRNKDDEVPETCRFQNYCTEKPADYPQEHFNQMFKNYTPIRFPHPTLNTDVIERFGGFDGTDDCNSEVSFTPLYQVRDQRRNWRTVVQAPVANYVQRVRLETCTNPSGSCFNEFPHVPGITTFCKQKTSKWQFLVSDNKGGTEMLDVELPICCSCHYKN